MTTGLSIDAVVALSPLLVLGVLLLLGFAGCKFEPGRLPDPPPPTPTLTFRARVPTDLSVIRAGFAWESTNTPRAAASVTIASGTDGGENLFEHTLTDPAPEGWRVRCEVVVQGGPAETPLANGAAMLDGSIEDPVMTFRATGPAAQLIVMYVGTA